MCRHTGRSESASLRQSAFRIALAFRRAAAIIGLFAFFSVVCAGCDLVDQTAGPDERNSHTAVEQPVDTHDDTETPDPSAQLSGFLEQLLRHSLAAFLL